MIYVISRHQTTINQLKNLFGDVTVISEKDLDNIQNSVIVGTLPIDLIAKVTANGNYFINIAIDPNKFAETYGAQYNPKTAEQYIAQNPDMLPYVWRFLLYPPNSVQINEVSVPEIVEIAKKHGGYNYKGSPQFNEGLAKLLGLPNTPKGFPFTPSEKGQFVSMRVLDRNLVVNNGDEFVNAVNSNKIKFYLVNAVAEPINNLQQFVDIVKKLSENRMGMSVSM